MLSCQIASAINRVTTMDERKQPEPEIMPPVPKTEPQPGGVEIPPDKDPPQKQSPISAEER